jgi:hypothetical protein
MDENEATNRHVSWVYTIYPRGPPPFRYRAETGSLGSVSLGILCISGGEKIDRFEFIRLRRLEQKPIYRRRATVKTNDGSHMSVNVPMRPQIMVIMNRTAATVIGTEICKFCKYHACVRKRSRSTGVSDRPSGQVRLKKGKTFAVFKGLAVWHVPFRHVPP